MRKNSELKVVRKKIEDRVGKSRIIAHTRVVKSLKRVENSSVGDLAVEVLNPLDDDIVGFREIRTK